MLFGLASAPAIFMDLMNKLFCNYLDWFVVVFIDILVYSTSRKEQEDHLRAVLKILWENKFFFVFFCFVNIWENKLFVKLCHLALSFRLYVEPFVLAGLMLLTYFYFLWPLKN